MDKVKLQYQLQPSVRGGYKVNVKPYSEHEAMNNRLVLVAEMCILNKLADDISIRLANIPCVKEQCHTQAKSFGHRFNDVRRKMCRFVGGRDKFERFEGDICKIIDESEDEITWLEKSLKSEIVGKVSWNYVEVVMVSGILGGLIDILMFIHDRLYNKRCDEYEEIKAGVNAIERCFGDYLLNKDIQPDYSGLYGQMDKFFKNVKKKSEAFVENAKKERRLLCSKETRTA